MPRQILTTLVIAMLLGGMTFMAIAAPPANGRSLFKQPAGVHWQSSLQEAHKQALAENKPILIVFGAEWCGFCTKLEKQTLSSPEVARYINENYVAVHLDLDKEKRIGQILEVESLPNTVMLSPNADLLGRITGFQAPGPFQENLVNANQLYRSLAIQPASGSGSARR